MSGDSRMNMDSSWPQPAMHAQVVPASHTTSRTYSARATMSTLPSSASSMVPTDRPCRLLASRKLRTCEDSKGFREVWEGVRVTRNQGLSCVV